MSLQTVKARLTGSYLLLVVLFVIQVPIIYTIIGGMGQKYVQEDVAGSLRKRAVEVAEVLNRHILTGDESLEVVFQTKKAEYDSVIETLRTGSDTVAPITNPEILAKLDMVESSWDEMKELLDSGMEHGDLLTETRIVVQDTTFPLVAKLNEVIAAELALDDPKISKFLNVTGLQRMRTVKLSYLLERYFTSYEDKTAAALEIHKTADAFETTLGELKELALGTLSRGAKGENFLSAVEGAEEIWILRKAKMETAMSASDSYRATATELSSVKTVEVVALADELTKLFISKAQESGDKSVQLVALAVLISAIIAGFFMWSANVMILRPLTKVKETVEKFANGDLTSRANVKVSLLGKEFKDEVTSLGVSVDKMADQMSNVIGKITDSSAHLASASEQLSVSTSQIEEGANRQSGQTAQVATAMEEMSATVIEVAKNSQEVSESARNAEEIALNGGEIVKDTVSAMQEVSESTSVTAEMIGKLGQSSEKIGSIVSVINDIADQTNLLALNAAIEAARAGDQGRGFAVVADEVRKLAERTTSATKEISGMISTIQIETTKAVEAMDEGIKKVDTGVKLAGETGEVLTKIVTGVKSVSDMVSHIATSTEEQSATADEITRNMDAISEVAGSNVTSIKEVSNATGEMARLATELKGLVSGFKVADRDEWSATTPSAATVVSIKRGKAHVA